MVLLFDQPLFDDRQHAPRAHAIITTREFGVVHPKHPDFPEQIARLMDITHVNTVVAQSLAMETGMADMVRNRAVLKPTDIPGFFRTHEPADGIVIPQAIDTVHNRVAALVMVADSGVVKILAPDGRIAVLNLSLECVDPPDGESIVTRAIRHLVTTTRDGIGFTARDLSVEVGHAAGPCCYGINPQDSKWGEKNRARLERIARKWNGEILGTVEYPPRRGWSSIDLVSLAMRQAMDEGVLRIGGNITCTSHEGLEIAGVEHGSTQGTFFSRIRGARDGVQPGGYNERQAVLVFGTGDQCERADRPRHLAVREPVVAHTSSSAAHWRDRLSRRPQFVSATRHGSPEPDWSPSSL